MFVFFVTDHFNYTMTQGRKAILTISLILILDQVVKIIVKTNMFLYQDIHVMGDWFIFKFIENNGMAFGINLPGDYGKMILSLFRIAAGIGLGFYIRHLIRLKSPTGLIISVSMIMAGAFGNVFDSLFYGMIFSESTPYSLAVLFPDGGGYSSFLHGKVVDIFYFPIIKGFYPDWFPVMGGRSFEFFRPVFNIADSSITLGVTAILIFQKKFFPPDNEKKSLEKKDDSNQNTE